MQTVIKNILVAPPFPDGEIVNSYLKRLQSYSGPPSLALACNRLLKRRPGLDGMPSGLRAFHEIVGHLFGGIDLLIDRHTDFNFYSSGLSKHRIHVQRERLTEPCIGPVRLCRLPVLFGVTEGAYLQCADCDEEQMRMYGFAFTHRRTGAPFVCICAIHGTQLRPKGEQMLLFDSYCRRSHTSYQIARSIEFGKRVNLCLEARHGQWIYHRDDVQVLLKQSGWLSENGRVYVADLVDRFSKFFSGSFADERLDLLCRSVRYVESALRCLFTPNRNVHPVWCILLAWFAESESRPVPRTISKEACAAVQPTHEMLQLNIESHKTIAAAARAMAISTSRFTCLCKRYGVEIKWRPKKLDRELVSQIDSAYSSGMLPKDVMKKFKVSQATAYRLLVSRKDGGQTLRRSRIEVRTETDKTAWLRAMSDRPEVPPTELRKLNLALWSRLSRNAKSWLQAHQPPPKGRASQPVAPPPKELLDRLDAALEEAAVRLSTAGQRPVRRSLYRLRLLAGVSEYAFQSARKDDAFSLRGEDRGEFIGRRVRWASREGATDTAPLWLIAKRAGIRHSSMREILEPLVEIEPFDSSEEPVA